MTYNRNYLKYLPTWICLLSFISLVFYFSSSFLSLWSFLGSTLTSYLFSHSSLSISDCMQIIWDLFSGTSPLKAMEITCKILVISFTSREIELLLFLPSFYAVFSNPFLKLIKWLFLHFLLAHSCFSGLLFGMLSSTVTQLPYKLL